MNKPASALIICFILLFSVLTFGIFSKMVFLPVVAKKNSSESSNSNNATKTTNSNSTPDVTSHKKHANLSNMASHNNTTITKKTPIKNATNITTTNATQATTNATQPLSCFSKELLKCYWKMIFQITPAPADKLSDFVIHITGNPRHLADFPAVGKSTVRYLLPGDYSIYFIYKGINQGLYCAGAAPIGAHKGSPF
jgi:hypothetical protein